MDGITANVILGVLHRGGFAEDAHAALGRGICG
jgi:hypothetical protein